MIRRHRRPSLVPRIEGLEGRRLLTTGTVTIAADAAHAVEQGPISSGFTITRSGGDWTSPAYVYFAISGTATTGTDYATLGGPATIPAYQGAARVVVNPIDDARADGPETVTLRVTGVCGGGAAYTVAAPDTATITIDDNGVPPLISVQAIAANASERGPTNGTYRISRTGGTAADLAVNFAMTGSAVPVSDYGLSSSTLGITIPAGAASVDITLVPVNDAPSEPAEAATLTLAGGTGYALDPNPGNQAATVTLTNAGRPTVTIAASGLPSEEGPINGTFTVTRAGDPATFAQPLTVSFSLGGTANSASEYAVGGASATMFTPTAGAVTIPAYASSADITIAPVDDCVVDPNKTVVATLTGGGPGMPYDYSTPPPGAALTIEDNHGSSTATGVHLDFGTAASPAAGCHAQVTEATRYTPGLWGWSVGQVYSADRGTGSNLNRDFNYTNDAVFKVDLADGTYTVQVTLGDLGVYAHDAMGVFLQGAQVDSVSTAAGQVVTKFYTAAVTCGLLRLELRDLGGSDPFACIEALDVTPAPGQPTSGYYDFGTATSPVAAGYTQVTEATTYSLAQGYGWSAGGIYSADRGNASDLNRDFNYTNDGTFSVFLSPATYTVTLTLGDTGPYAHDRVGVYIQGVLVDTVDTAAGTIVVNTYSADVECSLLQVRVADLGGADPFTVIEGLAIALGPPPPAPAAVDLDVIKANGTELAESQEESPGGFVPLNNDNDDYDYDQFGNPILDMNDTNGVVRENDWIPIKLHAARNAVQGDTFVLNYDTSKLNVYNLVQKIKVISGVTQLDPSIDKLLYVEGIAQSVAAADATVTLQLVNGGNVKASDLVKLTVYVVTGATNVPQFGSYIHNGYVPGGGIGTWDATGGVLKNGANSNRATIQWGATRLAATRA